LNLVTDREAPLSLVVGRLVDVVSKQIAPLLILDLGRLATPDLLGSDTYGHVQQSNDGDLMSVGFSTPSIRKWAAYLRCNIQPFLRADQLTEKRIGPGLALLRPACSAR